MGGGPRRSIFFGIGANKCGSLVKKKNIELLSSE